MSELKTVDEIMEMVRQLTATPAGKRMVRSEALRAAITDLHAAATRKQEPGLSEKDERWERAVST